MTSIKGVILDVDGTLVDSNDAHIEAWVRVIRAHGYDISVEKVRGLIGMGGDNFLPAAIGLEKDSALGQQIAQERTALLQREYFPRLQPFPKVADLLARMKNAGLRLVVASSSEADELRTLLQIMGAADLLDGQVSAGDAEHSKPDPDIVQAALQKLGLNPDEVILIGDSPYDLEAAAQAGIGVIALRCGGFSDADLAGALAVYDSPADLLLNYAASPLSTTSQV